MYPVSMISSTKKNSKKINPKPKYESNTRIAILLNNKLLEFFMVKYLRHSFQISAKKFQIWRSCLHALLYSSFAVVETDCSTGRYLVSSEIHLCKKAMSSLKVSKITIRHCGWQIKMTLKTNPGWKVSERPLKSILLNMKKKINKKLPRFLSRNV